MSVDWAFFQILNDLAGKSPVLDVLIRLLMNDYLIPTALILFLLGLWFSGSSQQERERNQLAAPSAIVAMFAGNLFIKLLNVLFYRPRPFATHTIHLLFYRPSDSSFPSNATAVGFSMATAVWLHNRRAGAVMYVLASLLGLSRIIGGVHYPSDVLAGALVGIAVAHVVVRRLPIVQRLFLAVVRFLRGWVLA